jgi:hypothetical protein
VAKKFKRTGRPLNASSEMVSPSRPGRLNGGAGSPIEAKSGWTTPTLMPLVSPDEASGTPPRLSWLLTET